MSSAPRRFFLKQDSPIEMAVLRLEGHSDFCKKQEVRDVRQSARDFASRAKRRFNSQDRDSSKPNRTSPTTPSSRTNSSSSLAGEMNPSPSAYPPPAERPSPSRPTRSHRSRTTSLVRRSSISPTSAFLPRAPPQSALLVRRHGLVKQSTSPCREHSLREVWRARLPVRQPLAGKMTRRRNAGGKWFVFLRRWDGVSRRWRVD